MKDTLLKIAALLLLATAIYQMSEEPLDEYFDSDYFADALVDAGFDYQTNDDDKALLEQRKIVITTDINATLSRNLIRKLLILNAASPNEPIDIYMRTEGGWEADTFAIIDTMKSITSPVNMHAIGDVHSSGCMLLAAATGDRIVYDHSVIGFHALGADEDRIFENRYINFWREVANLPQSWLDRRDEELSYFTGEEAIKYGVADTLISKNAPAKDPS